MSRGRDEREDTGGSEEKGADWEMKRAEANSRKEVGRGEGKAVQDDGKTGDLSINYNTMEAVIDVACIERISDMTRRLGQMKTMEICTWIEICTKNKRLVLKRATMKRNEEKKKMEGIQSPQPYRHLKHDPT